MKTLEWQCLHFQQLDNNQLYDLIKLRVDIFVVEQECPYPELDDKDRHIDTRHLIAYQDSKLLAYARLLPPGLSYPEVSIGRFVVDSNSRFQGIGCILMDKSIAEVNEAWPNSNIRISAQQYLKQFYEKFGFTKVSDSYLEDGIPHIEMLKHHHQDTANK